MSQVEAPLATLSPTVDWSLVRSVFNMMLLDVEDAEIASVKLDDILGDESGSFNGVLEKVQVYSKRLGTNLLSSPHGHAFVNGKHFDLDDVRDMRILSH